MGDVRKFHAPGFEGQQWEDFFEGEGDEEELIATLEVGSEFKFSRATDGIFDITVQAETLTTAVCEEALGRVFKCEAKVVWLEQTLATNPREEG